MGRTEKKRIVVAAHGHCFDGIVSAALFTHLRRRIGDDDPAFSYKSCGYGPNMQVVPDRWLRGDENAIVDFRFSETERLTWYFDHHPTAFANDEQRDRALRRSDRFFYDPSYGSCTQLIADVGARRYGVSFDGYAELVRWADKIDRAAFASAEEAIDRSEPTKQLAAVVEKKGDGALYAQLIPRLLVEPADELAKSEEVQAYYRPLAEAQQHTRARIAAALEQQGGVAYADLHDEPLRSSGKFVAYALAPQCLYSVSLIRMRQHYKISIGYNPWSGQPRRHHIATICQRHGGGGHPVVGAISVPLAKLSEAQKIARSVIEELNQPPADG